MVTCKVCQSVLCTGRGPHATCARCREVYPAAEIGRSGRCAACIAATLATDPGVAGAAAAVVADRDDRAAVALAANTSVYDAAERLAGSCSDAAAAVVADLDGHRTGE